MLPKLIIHPHTPSFTTAREEDGLAMSSRNAYLDEKERKAAPVVYASLQAAQKAFEGAAGGKAVTAQELQTIVRDVLAKVRE